MKKFIEGYGWLPVATHGVIQIGTSLVRVELDKINGPVDRLDLPKGFKTEDDNKFSN